MTHYFFHRHSLCATFFSCLISVQRLYLRRKKEQLCKIYSIIFFVSMPKKEILYMLQSKLLSWRNLPTTPTSSFKHSLFWKLHSGHKDAVYLQRCQWAPREFFAAEVTSWMQYLVYAYFFVRPLQGSKWGLSGHVAGCEMWVCDKEVLQIPVDLLRKLGACERLCFFLYQAKTYCTVINVWL